MNWAASRVRRQHVVPVVAPSLNAQKKRIHENALLDYAPKKIKTSGSVRHREAGATRGQAQNDPFGRSTSLRCAAAKPTLATCTAAWSYPVVRLQGIVGCVGN